MCYCVIEKEIKDDSEIFGPGNPKIQIRKTSSILDKLSLSCHVGSKENELEFRLISGLEM